VIRDKRRIDPVTGEVREPAQTPAPGAPAGAEETAATTGDPMLDNETGEENSEVGKLQDQLEERTGDLQRLQAEYSNYRKRVERDRVAVREQSLGNVLGGLLPVLDDIGRARDHDELTGGFKSVGEALEAAVGKLGLERFGEKGEPFDPTVHEALLHSYSADVTVPTCVDILQPGYRIGARILRPARVSVAEPAEPLGPADPTGLAEPVEPAETDDTK
jgi:molecular chaperone GrpE